MLTLLSLEGVGEAAEVALQLRQERILQGREDLVGIGDFLVDVRCDVDHAAPIGATNRRETAAHLHFGNGAKRNLASLRCSDAHVLDVVERTAAIGRVADHDPDFIAASLDALHLFSVERLSNLPAEIDHGQAECLGGW